MPATLPTFPGLTFDENNGLTRARIATPAATATVYLHGAHLTAWQPAGEEPVIFLSDTSEFAAAKPIRGGIPVIFPWFGPDLRGPERDAGPTHGFARLEAWSLIEARLEADGDAVLAFELRPTALSRSVGFDNFVVQLEHRIGRTLTTRLTVVNAGAASLTFEAALHTYFQVADIHTTHVSGLEQTAFVDKVQNFTAMPAAHAPIVFKGPIDRIYPGATGACTIDDGERRVVVTKSGSQTTVVWNPWKAMADLPAAQWPHMACVETANVGGNAVTLAPGASHTMESTVSVQK